MKNLDRIEKYLYPAQFESVKDIFKGCILNGGTGSGKTITSLSYFLYKYVNIVGNRVKVTKNIVVLTTAKKRDSKDWEGELVYSFNKYSNGLDYNILDHLIVDSWNNIKKYKEYSDCFFIFDEQMVSGYGVWSKTFIHITKNNDWIILSATPGDTWSDYISIFIANNFYKNKTDFIRQHVVYSRFSKYPKIERYINTDKLEKIRNKLLIDISVYRKTVHHDIDVFCEFDREAYRLAYKRKFDPFKGEFVHDASSMVHVLRRIVNETTSRFTQTGALIKERKKVIIFYNFNYELDSLKYLCDALGWPYSEWNGHRHDNIPSGDKWAYLVQYIARQ